MHFFFFFWFATISKFFWRTRELEQFFFLSCNLQVILLTLKVILLQIMHLSVCLSGAFKKCACLLTYLQPGQLLYRVSCILDIISWILTVCEFLDVSKQCIKKRKELRRLKSYNKGIRFVSSFYSIIMLILNLHHF